MRPWSFFVANVGLALEQPYRTSKRRRLKDGFRPRFRHDSNALLRVADRLPEHPLDHFVPFRCD